MLTALELYGFKSFPDRTRFEFPPGITVIVGPNGSGKSNIVDGIKWVLGEQSAKSLRGKEMADVIFKGTGGSHGRKASNTAEATLIFDNSSRRLPLDQDEVRLTRRVYRSGEGEYLINGEPCRLKDIRNLVRGTGVGADAYSLIEQGKVDQLLKASPRERRAIFEEAAGISRFKAKKVEAERRLARVEQNLVRLADIVEEVGNRYRKIQSQATKAARYKEYTERLKVLRTFVGAKDWRDFSGHLEKIESEKSTLTEQAENDQSTLEQLENENREHEVRMSEWSSRILASQQSINSLIQQITERQSNIALHQSRIDDLVVQETAQRESLQRLTHRDTELTGKMAQSAAFKQEAATACSRAQQELAETEQKLGAFRQQYQSLRETAETRKQEQASVNLQLAELGKAISAADSRLTISNTTRQKLEQKLQSLDQDITAKSQKLQTCQDAQQRLQNEAAARDDALKQAQANLKTLRGELEEGRKKLAEKRRAQTGATQRAEVIQELESRLEGVDSGIREIIERSQKDNDPWLQDVHGLVADVIKVNVQHAELVDLALGEYSRCLIVEGEQLVQRLISGQLKPSGRLRLIRLENPPTLGARPGVDLSHEEGVVGRLDQLIQVEPSCQQLAHNLLGGTFLVKTLNDAFRLREHKSAPLRFVTLDGDVLEADGTLSSGPRSSVSGIVSRRSELRALHREVHRLNEEIETDQQAIKNLKQDAASEEALVQRLLGENTEIATRLNEQNSVARSLSQQIEVQQSERHQVQSEISELTEQIESLKQDVSRDQRSLKQAETALQTLVTFAHESTVKLQELETAIGDLQQTGTSLKVTLAKSQQQLEEAERNHQSMVDQLAEAVESIATTRSSLAALLWQRRSSIREVADSGGLLGGFEQQRSALDDELAALTRQRDEANQGKKTVSQRLASTRRQLQESRDRLHQIELKESQLSMEREQLAQRLQDDYGINVADLDQQQDEVDEDRDAIDNEITDLRRKIGNIGSVNMDALLELEEMQERFEALDAQYQDLVMAREALEKIIHKINADSRRLFEETLQAIRVNFQKLFRQTFGGGRADLVIEEDVDILDAGIDIVATPPGKPEFNNSLLSGGERALTAVSLLMAIFQFRPSPFCVLDEVDAPFDEANVGRFIDVLKSFLDWTKFVIVTHSKVTMTSATTLYGVTMQESGVSKRVSVRFEDVNEDGEISEEAVKRDSGDEKVA